MANIRISGFGGPGDQVTQYNAVALAVLQEVVDEVNDGLERDQAGNPINPYLLGTYIQARIDDMIASWMAERVEIKSRAVKLAYEAADDSTKDQVALILGL